MLTNATDIIQSTEGLSRKKKKRQKRGEFTLYLSCYIYILLPLDTNIPCSQTSGLRLGLKHHQLPWISSLDTQD